MSTCTALPRTPAPPSSRSRSRADTRRKPQWACPAGCAPPPRFQGRTTWLRRLLRTQSALGRSRRGGACTPACREIRGGGWVGWRAAQVCVREGGMRGCGIQQQSETVDDGLKLEPFFFYDARRRSSLRERGEIRAMSQQALGIPRMSRQPDIRRISQGPPPHHGVVERRLQLRLGIASPIGGNPHRLALLAAAAAAD